MRQGELEVLDSELLDVGALDILGLLKLDDLEDLNAAETGTVASSHVVVEGGNGICTAELAELLVHIVSARAGVVAEPDTKVLDLGGALLEDLVDGKDLAVSLLDTAELSQKVPETRFGDDLIRCEDTHAVELGLRVALSRQVASDHLVLFQCHL